MTSKIELLRSNIDNTESIVMLKLDSVRNYLLTADMILALTSCTLAIGMMITGVFGTCFFFPFHYVLGGRLGPGHGREGLTLHSVVAAAVCCCWPRS